MSAETTATNPAPQPGGNGGGIGRHVPVLVVEDECWVAFDLADMLGDMGFEDVEVCASFQAAERALDGRDFAIAIFDLNLDGTMSRPLIRRAAEAGTFVVIASGYEARTVPSDDPSLPRIVKPYSEKDVAKALAPVL